MTRKDEIMKRISYLMNDMKLSFTEAETAIKFIMKHRNCSTICKSFNQVKYTIYFSETSMGSFIKIQCEKCNMEKDISDEVRSNW